MHHGIYREDLARFLREDLAWGDPTTLSVVPPGRVRARVVAREDGVMACPWVAQAVLGILSPDAGAVPLFGAGQAFRRGDTLVEILGDARVVLAAERVLLNLMSLALGVATRVRALVDALGPGGPGLLDTRKTIPGLRFLEREAWRDGGGLNHRNTLGDLILIKDNHIALAGSIREAVARARRAAGPRPVEVECEDLDQVAEAMEAGADIIMLDNMEPGEVARAVELVAKRAKVEVSGGIGPDNVAKYAIGGVDFISSSWPLRGWVDLSLEV